MLTKVLTSVEEQTRVCVCVWGGCSVQLLYIEVRQMAKGHLFNRFLNTKNEPNQSVVPLNVSLHDSKVCISFGKYDTSKVNWDICRKTDGCLQDLFVLFLDWLTNVALFEAAAKLYVSNYVTRSTGTAVPQYLLFPGGHQWLRSRSTDTHLIADVDHMFFAKNKYRWEIGSLSWICS